MTKFYKEDWEVPDDLKKRISEIRSNRKPDQEIKIDAKLFVSLFRDDMEKWLKEHRENVAKEKK